MTKNILYLIVAALMMTACSKNEEVPTDGPLGSLPATVLSNAEKEAELKAEFQKASADQDAERAQKIMNQGFTQEQMAEENLKTAGATLEGKEVPVEMGQGLGMKALGSFTISDVGSSSATVQVRGEVELTEKASFDINFSGQRLDQLGGVVMDAEGKFFATATCSFSTQGHFMEVYQPGRKGTMSIRFKVEPWNADAMARLGKIVVTMKISDEFEKAKVAAESAKEAYEASNEK